MVTLAVVAPIARYRHAHTSNRVLRRSLGRWTSPLTAQAAARRPSARAPSRFPGARRLPRDRRPEAGWPSAPQTPTHPRLRTPPPTHPPHPGRPRPHPHTAPPPPGVSLGRTPAAPPPPPPPPPHP